MGAPLGSMGSPVHATGGGNFPSPVSLSLSFSLSVARSLCLSLVLSVCRSFSLSVSRSLCLSLSPVRCVWRAGGLRCVRRQRDTQLLLPGTPYTVPIWHIHDSHGLGF